MVKKLSSFANKPLDFACEKLPLEIDCDISEPGTEALGIRQELKQLNLLSIFHDLVGTVGFIPEMLQEDIASLEASLDEIVGPSVEMVADKDEPTCARVFW